jgi:hypothetical protein
VCGRGAAVPAGGGTGNMVHNLPLLYALTMRAAADPVMFFIDGPFMASIAIGSLKSRSPDSPGA